MHFERLQAQEEAMFRESLASDSFWVPVEEPVQAKPAALPAYNPDAIWA
jgi:hypothetical protein